MNADEMFDSVAEAMVGEPGVTRAKMFGSPGLRVGRKFFGCLVNGKLIIKLPQARVQAIIGSGGGDPFGHIYRPGMGRMMKEWVAVDPSSTTDWLSLSREARDFVASAGYPI